MFMARQKVVVCVGYYDTELSVLKTLLKASQLPILL